MLTESWVKGKSVEEKAQPTKRTAALWGLSSKFDSRIWEWTEAGVKASRATTHTDMSRNLATVVVRGVLPGAKEKKNWTVAQWSKVLFSDESKLCI